LFFFQCNVWFCLRHHFCRERIAWTHSGDLILTGTPAGVGPVQPGQRLHATLANSADGKPVGTALLGGQISPRWRNALIWF
jgi:hypothetical protein